MKQFLNNSKVILLCFFLFAYVGLRLSKQDSNNNKMTSSFIAKKDILPRTRIQETDIEEIKVHTSFINKNTIQNKYDIIGKYTDIQGKIPAGSFFYKTMLFDAEELPDYPSTQLYANQSIFQLQLDALSLSYLTKSQRIDISATIQTNTTQCTDMIVYHSRILMIQDCNGIDIESQESTTIPNAILIAVNTSDIEILNELKTIATFQVQVSAKTYEQAEAQINTKSKLIAYMK